MKSREAEVAVIKLSEHHSAYVEVYYPCYKGIVWPGYVLKVQLCTFVTEKTADSEAFRMIVSESNSWTPTKCRNLEEANRFSQHKLTKWVKQLQETKSYMDLVDVFRPYAAEYAAKQAEKGE